MDPAETKPNTADELHRYLDSPGAIQKERRQKHRHKLTFRLQQHPQIRLTSGQRKVSLPAVTVCYLLLNAPEWWLYVTL